MVIHDFVATRIGQSQSDILEDFNEYQKQYSTSFKTHHRYIALLMLFVYCGRQKTANRELSFSSMSAFSYKDSFVLQCSDYLQMKGASTVRCQ